MKIHKKVSIGIALIIISAMFVACGAKKDQSDSTGDTDTEINADSTEAAVTDSDGVRKPSNEFYPEKITNLQSGGSSSGQNIDVPSNYDLLSLNGEWVLATNSSSLNLTDELNKMVVTYKDFIGNSYENTMGYFPKGFTIKDWFDIDGQDKSSDGGFSIPTISAGTSGSLSDQANTIREHFESTKSNPYNTSHEDAENVCKAINDLGYGIGFVRPVWVKTNQNNDDTYGANMYDTSLFSINGSKLYIGLLNQWDSTAGDFEKMNFAMDEASVTELSFDYEFTGRELILTHNGISAKYVPSSPSLPMLDSEKYFTGSAVDTDSVADGIISLSFVSDNKINIMYELTEGYQEVPFSFTDSSITIDGNTYDYLRSDDCFTLIDSNGSHLYSSKVKYSPSPQYRQSTNIILNNWLIGLNYQDIIFDALIYCGATSSISTDAIIEPGEVSDLIKMNVNGTDFAVKVANFHNYAQAISDCAIAAIYMNDTSGYIGKEDSTLETHCTAITGETTYEEIRNYYSAPYEATPDSLVYKSHSTDGNIMTMASYDEAHSRLYLPENEYEIKYQFSNNILKEIQLINPSLLYSGLQDNVESDDLDSMNIATISIARENKDTVLTRLQKAFNDSGITVEINEETGEIVMDSSILFDFNSSDLSSEGKAYIDSFMNVYTSVLLDEDLKDIITGIKFEGHTDSNGGYDYNLVLSQKRADTVMDYCIFQSDALSTDQKKSLSAISEAIGYSYSDPVVDAQGNEDAAASRRVAIKFYVSTTKSI